MELFFLCTIGLAGVSFLSMALAQSSAKVQNETKTKTPAPTPPKDLSTKKVLEKVKSELLAPVSA